MSTLMPEFIKFSKIARLSRDIIITEKIDGTNAQLFITEDGDIFAGSRNRWITPDDDNFGFAEWAVEHEQDLLTLGAGRHFGEWWGQGIQRKYGLDHKRFSLFNIKKWDTHERPACCNVVPVLYKGPFTEEAVLNTLDNLKTNGSVASPGFMKPEGIILYHTAGGGLFKKTLENDEIPKYVLEQRRKAALGI